MELKELVRYVFIFFVILLPVLQWIFKKLYELTNRANRLARDIESRDLQGRSNDRRSQRFDEEEGEWEIIEDEDLDPFQRRDTREERNWELEEAERDVRDFSDRPLQERATRPSPAVRTSPEVRRFLDELAGTGSSRQGASRQPSSRRPQPQMLRRSSTPAAPPFPANPEPSYSSLVSQTADVAASSLDASEIGSGERERERAAAEARRRQLANYIVWSEILSKPIALRDESNNDF